jgi:hypothetical protein
MYRTVFIYSKSIQEFLSVLNHYVCQQVHQALETSAIYKQALDRLYSPNHTQLCCPLQPYGLGSTPHWPENSGACWWRFMCFHVSKCQKFWSSASNRHINYPSASEMGFGAYLQLLQWSQHSFPWGSCQIFSYLSTVLRVCLSCLITQSR